MLGDSTSLKNPNLICSMVCISPDSLRSSSVMERPPFSNPHSVLLSGFSVAVDELM